MWAPLRPSLPLAQALGIRAPIHVPFLTIGEETGHVEQGPVSFGPKHLLFGILVGYLDAPPTLDIAALRPQLRQILIGLGQGFGLPSLETCILNGALALASEDSPDAQRRALATGRVLLPRSSPIASDYIMATWEVVKAANDTERARFWRDIHEAASSIDYDEIMPAAREGIAFFHFTAVRCLGDAGVIVHVLENEVYAHVNQPALKVKIKRALEDPNSEPAYLYA